MKLRWKFVQAEDESLHSEERSDVTQIPTQSVRRAAAGTPESASRSGSGQIKRMGW